MIAILLVLVFNSLAQAQATEPINGPYIACGKIIAKFREPIVFEVNSARYTHRLELTSRDRTGKTIAMATFILEALGSRSMGHVCIRGFVYRNSKNKPVLVPASANLRYDQLL